MRPDGEAYWTEQAALVADVLRLKAEHLFEQAKVAGIHDPVHDEYLEAQKSYEEFMREFGQSTAVRLRWTAAEASREAAEAKDGQRTPSADRKWNRCLDFMADHHEELRLNQRSR